MAQATTPVAALCRALRLSNYGIDDLAKIVSTISSELQAERFADLNTFDSEDLLDKAADAMESAEVFAFTAEDAADERAENSRQDDICARFAPLGAL